MFLKTCAVLGAFLCLASSLRAELAWTKPMQEFQVLPDQKEVEAHFTFKNAGAIPVTVRSVKTSCGCTTAQLPKKTYAPGESGELVAIYHFHGQTGALRKLVTVTTDEHPDQPMVLDIRVFVHEPFEVRPALVYWRTGEPGEPKSVQLLANGYPVRVRSVSSSNPAFTASLAADKEGEHYTVAVKPAATAEKDSAEISVLTDFPPASPRTYTIHARIK